MDFEAAKWFIKNGCQILKKEANSYLSTLSSKSVVQVSDEDKKNKQVSEENTKLQSQVLQYRNVLAETEEKLTQLQKSVESEEKIWQEKLHTSESELNQSKQEITTLKEELKKHHGSTEHLNDVDFAYRCVEKSLPTIVEQLENRIQELKGDLEKIELEKKENINKCESRITELEHIIHTKEESHTLIERQTHELKTKLAEKESQLEKEMQKCNQLNQQLASKGTESGTSV